MSKFKHKCIKPPCQKETSSLTEMTKKTTSNVPNNNNVNNNNSNNNNNNNNGNIQHNTPPKMKNNHKNHSHYQNQSNSNGIINSKHFHNQSHQQKLKKKKETTLNDGNNENILMKKLFEALQKQKHKEKEISLTEEVKKSKKAAIVSHSQSKTMNSSENYAGAAFDRSPSGNSFPIPSFLKSTKNNEIIDFGSTLLSTPCDDDGNNNSDDVNNLKSLSINDLFKTKNDVEKVEKKKLENLTNDLRRILNLR